MRLSELLTILAEVPGDRGEAFANCIRMAKEMESEREGFWKDVSAMKDRYYDYNRTRQLLEEMTGKTIEVGELWKVAADLRDALGKPVEGKRK